MDKRFWVLVFFAGWGVFSVHAQEKMLFTDDSLPVHERVVDLLSRLTIEEKISLLYASSPGIPRLQTARFTDLLTFWSFTVNMERDTRWGRTSETYGEDYYQSVALRTAFAKGFQEFSQTTIGKGENKRVDIWKDMLRYWDEKQNNFVTPAGSYTFMIGSSSQDIHLTKEWVFTSSNGITEVQRKENNIIANPINLNYRFQFNNPSRREAADPVIEYFKGKYYLFASKSGGYWSSEGMSEWKYIPCKSIATIEEYAPAILVLDNELYYLGSGSPKIYKTGNPDIDKWEAIETKFRYPLVGSVDPAFFKDDDGRLYIYWGCSDKDPIIGVEVDPKDGFKVVGEAVVLIEHHSAKYGWEESGENNEKGKEGWNEGACMIKHNGKYYLHYAAPGTEFRVYGSGVYVSDKPLGPYIYEENSPFLFKPGGFIGGAGHGHTFRDKHGNFWHVATMRISVRHPFERRLGLFPVFISDDNCIYSHSVFTDYPFKIPHEKINFDFNNLSMNWNLLSYRKKTLASSSLPGYEAEKGSDEQVETWWSAQTGKKDEWWQLDLGRKMKINALQVNFADEGFILKAPDSFFNYQYLIEYSDDGNKWNVLTDRSKNEKDIPHELIVLGNEVETRFLRITNSKNMDGKFSLSDFRVFGNGKGAVPKNVSGVKINRGEDKRKISFQWNKQRNTTGYVIRWGVKRNKLNNAVMVFENQFEGGFFNRDSRYYFSIDAFNENGVTKGTEVYEKQ